MTAVTFMCAIYGILVGFVGAYENENIFKILLASFLSGCAISLWFS